MRMPHGETKKKNMLPPVPAAPTPPALAPPTLAAAAAATTMTAAATTTTTLVNNSNNQNVLLASFHQDFMSVQRGKNLAYFVRYYFYNFDVTFDTYFIFSISSTFE